MTGCRKTAQMLTVSVISMMICTVMLLGTTFAWFQENVTASVTITAETLSAALLDAEGNLLGGQGNVTTLSSEETDVKSVVFYEVLPGQSSTEPEGENITTLSTEPAAVWDLGKTYQTPTMTLVNTGSLKTKYTISVEGIEEALKEAFVFEVLLDGVSYAVPLIGELSADENDAAVTFAIQVRLDADKAATAAGASLENMVINIIAEQTE